MRILLIHNEANYFAGAERMLGYFLPGLQARGCQVMVACVDSSRVAALVPAGMQRLVISDNQRFSPMRLWSQARSVLGVRKSFPFEIVHGWAARDWELTALTARLGARPALGTLHDHPRASFISRQRRILMRWSLRLGLRRVVCVSDAVHQACVSAGYPAEDLTVVRNGLPLGVDRAERGRNDVFRIGYLGAISERKGLRDLFRALDELAKLTPLPWALEVAGEPLDEDGRHYLAGIQRDFNQRPWWMQVRWLGWIEQSGAFLRSIDLLVCPSAEFDPFPTVLLEAGDAGTAVLAARVGGVEEIVVEGSTGWLFSPGEPTQASHCLAGLLAEPALARAAGEKGRHRTRSEFSMTRMAADYLRVYSELLKT